MIDTVIKTGAPTIETLLGAAYLRKAAIVVLGALFLATMSQIALRGPVPMTLHTLAVMLIGLTFGLRMGVAAVALYLAAGSLGLPVYAEGRSGLPIGPTGGFLVGFLAEVAIIGYLAGKGVTRSWAGTAGALFLGEAVMFGLGVLWLANFLGQPT